MGHKSKLKMAALGSVSFLILGFLCATSVTHLYGSTSGPALLDPGSHGSAYTCSESYSRSSFSIAAANTGKPYGGEKLGDAADSFVLPPIDGLSIGARPLSGGTLLSFAKASLNILFCVHTL